MDKAENQPQQATHDEICDMALEHYEEVSNKAHCSLSTIRHAIEFYRKHGDTQTPSMGDLGNSGKAKGGR